MPQETSPKRRNAPATRARILQAAFEGFSTLGYAQTGVREIAIRAGVAPSLVLRYFGSKSTLFEAALVNGIFLNSMFPRERRTFGEQMTRLVVREGDANLVAVMALAMVDPDARDVAMRVARRHIMEPLAEWLGPPDAMARAMNMMTLLSGFTIQSRQMSPAAIPSASRVWLAQSLQAIVDVGAVD